MVIHASDLERSVFDTSSLIDINKYSSILDNKIGRYIFFKYAFYKLKKSNNAISNLAKRIKKLHTVLDDKDYNEFVILLDEIIEHNEKTKISFNEVGVFNDEQRKTLNETFKSFFKNAVKAKSNLSGNHFKGKPKVNDSSLRELIITNNNLQLAKKL